MELKLSNMNLEDMFVANRTDELLSVFAERLWRDSSCVYLTMVVAPSDVGGRLPINPREKEGFVSLVSACTSSPSDLFTSEAICSHLLPFAPICSR